MQFTVATAGSGRGSFQPRQDANGGIIPTALAVGDVDGDGDVNALTVLENTHQVLVRLNGGDATGTATGSFRNGSVVDVGRYPVSVTLGDVDGDGDLDMLTSNFSSSQGTVSIRLNGGDSSGSHTGLFSQGSEVAVDNVPRQVILGDVDVDGDLDLERVWELGSPK